MKQRYASDTIAAIATPPGRGGIGIVRVSGPLAKTIAIALTRPLSLSSSSSSSSSSSLSSLSSYSPSSSPDSPLSPPSHQQTPLKPRYAHYAAFYDDKQAILDQGLMLFFPAPHSFTGEAVLECQGHGGPIVMELLLQRIVQLGARLARPGEFSERAFLNDKIDLSQAEAIADLINASSEQAARSAMRSLQGEFSSLIQGLIQQLIECRMHIEAAIDFPEEEIDFLQEDKLQQRLQKLLAEFEKIQQITWQGCLLREGLRVVIAGKPNAGKSSLLNALTGQETAIVTAIPGTTRDVLREHIHLDGIPLHLIDTAGLRDAEDPVEKIGVQRARDEIAQADLILLVAAADDFDLVDLKPYLTEKTLLIRNKIDLVREASQITTFQEMTQVSVSAKTKVGLDLLKNTIKARVGASQTGENTLIARRRHLLALEKAQNHLTQGVQQLHNFRAGELLAEECRLAQQSLAEITGEFTADDLLGEIFSRFCIGK